MVRQLLKYGAGLIALYIGVANASGLGSLFERGANGTSLVTKTLQGR
jgi:hypothetical protein